MRFIALDPGASTGYAEFEDAYPVEAGVLKFGDEFNDWLDNQHPELWVVEDYIVRPQNVAGYGHQWSKGEALQIIGAVKFHARSRMIPLILQQPSIKPMAAKMSGLEYKKGKKGVHMNDALLHGSYFWRTKGEKDHGLKEGR